MSHIFGRFGYDHLRGQCSQTDMKVYNVMELLGTFLPFSVMIFAYYRINRAVTSLHHLYPGNNQYNRSGNK